MQLFYYKKTGVVVEKLDSQISEKLKGNFFY